MSAKILFWTFTLLGVALEITGDVFFKKWTIGGRSALMVVGLMIYAAGAVFWAFSLKYEMLSKAISIFTILNLILVALIGMLYFKEQLSLVSKIGIVLGLISIVLIERG